LPADETPLVAIAFFPDRLPAQADGGLSVTTTPMPALAGGVPVRDVRVTVVDRAKETWRLSVRVRR
jgi:hypothetical protein